MLRYIIAGCDPNDSGRDALALAAVLAPPAGAYVLAVGVYPHPLVRFPPSFADHGSDEAETTLFLRAARDELCPDAQVRAIPGVSAARALAGVAELEHADLIVVGSTPDTPDGKVHAGRAAHQLLHGAPCAVALAPTGFHRRASAIRRIVIGADGSPESAAALQLAAPIAQATGARVEIVGVVADNTPTFDPMLALEHVPFAAERGIGLEEATRLMRGVVGAAAAAIPSATSRVEVGDAGMVLARTAEPGDLLVIGSRRWGPIARILLGTTGEYLAAHASSPLLVAGRPAPAAR